MQNLQTIILILLPMFIGFFISLPKTLLPLLDKLLNALVYGILLLIGMELAQVAGLLVRLKELTFYTLTLFTLLMIFNLAALFLLEKWQPHQKSATQSKQKSIEISGSFKQILTVLLGLAVGNYLPSHLLPPSFSATAALMLLVFVIGIQLRSNGIPLRSIFLNRQGMILSMVFITSCILAGLIFAALFEEISWGKGLALANGYGWYSLSGILMTQAYGADWGSIALINDLLREFFALIFIPILMRRSVGAAVGIGGATSLDFTLPLIQNSGGLSVVPLAVSFGFIVNLVAPFLMAIFSAY